MKTFSSLGEVENDRNRATVATYASLCVTSGHATSAIATVIDRGDDEHEMEGTVEPSIGAWSMDQTIVTACLHINAVDDTCL